jgi:hypothetical protein
MGDCTAFIMKFLESDCMANHTFIPSMTNRLSQVKLELGSLLFYLLFTLYIVNALFMFWIPANDFDTMSSYLARIKLEEFGPLRETATLEIQYLFPKFFDYLHAPFLRLGYLTTLPNFFLFTLVLFTIVRGFPAKQAAWGLILLFFCPAILLTLSAAKNDISLGLLAFLAWYAISYLKDSAFYAVISLSLIAMLIGTKWHGIVLAGFFMLYLGYQIAGQKQAGLKKLLIAVPFIPFYALFGSFDVYWANYTDFGSLMPRPSYLHRDVHLLTNISDLVVSLIIDTIEAPLHLIEYAVRGSISEFDYGFGKASRSLLVAASDFTTCGVLLLVVVVASGIALITKRVVAPYRVAAAACLLYCAVITYIFPYNTFINRYYIPAYILGIIPLASFCKNIAPKSYQWLLMIFFLVFSSYAVICNSEKRLLPMKITVDGHIERLKPIYPDLLERDSLYFNLWKGYKLVFNFMQTHIKPYQSLVIVNFSQNGNAPFIYPLIKDRAAANTGIINTRYLKTNDTLKDIHADFVMTFAEPIHLDKYQLIYDLGKLDCKDVCIYQHIS